MSELLCGACKDEDQLSVKAHRIVLPWKGLCERHFRQYERKEFCAPCQQGGVKRFATHRMNAMRMCREHAGAAAIVDAPPQALIPEDAEVRKDKPMSKNIDWSKVQQDRNAGASTTALAEKYGCSAPTICAHTKPAPKGGDRKPGRLEAIAERGSRKTSKNGSGRSATGFADVLADLRERREALEAERDALDEAITALEKVG